MFYCLFDMPISLISLFSFFRSFSYLLLIFPSSVVLLLFLFSLFPLGFSILVLFTFNFSFSSVFSPFFTSICFITFSLLFHTLKFPAAIFHLLSHLLSRNTNIHVYIAHVYITYTRRAQRMSASITSLAHYNQQ